MSVIDNKLINYGNLAEFHSKIIDDSSVSTLATWSSQLINNELADKQDVLTAGAGIDISNGVISATGGGGGGSVTIENITYAQLKAKRDNSQLAKGQQYRITDYVTMANSDTTPVSSAEHPFDLIVTAIDVNKLSETGVKVAHCANDDYFVSQPLRYYIDQDSSWAYPYKGTIEIDDATYYKWYCGNTIGSHAEYILTTQATYSNTPDGEDENGEYYYTTYQFAGFINSENEEVGDYSGWEESHKCIIKTEEIDGTMQLIVGDIFLADADTYQTSYEPKLNAWEVKYCIDNNKSRFNWAQVEHEGLGFAALKVSDEKTINKNILVLGDEYNCVGDDHEGEGHYYIDAGAYVFYEDGTITDNDTTYYKWYEEYKNLHVLTTQSTYTNSVSGTDGEGCEYYDTVYNIVGEVTIDDESFDNFYKSYKRIIKTDTEAQIIDDTFLYKRYANGDTQGNYAWVLVKNSANIDINDTVVDWNNIDTTDIIYTTSLTPSAGTVITSGGEVTEYNSNVQYIPEGKGVIYYLKDEFNNEAEYDFKNVIFNLGYNIIQTDCGGESYLYKRYPEADIESGFAYVYLNNSFSYSIDDYYDEYGSFNDIDSSELIYFENERPLDGEYNNNDECFVMESKYYENGSKFTFGVVSEIYNPIDDTFNGNSNNNNIESKIIDEVRYIPVLNLPSETVNYGKGGLNYQAGNNIQINNGVISATDTTYSAGNNISINGNNQISCTYQYILPAASISTLGGVKVGNGLSINNGVLNVSSGDNITLTNGAINCNYTNVDNGIVNNNGTLELSSDIYELLQVMIETEYNSRQLNGKYLTFEATQDDTNISLKNTFISSSIKIVEIECSKDLVTWKKITSSRGQTIQLNTLNNGEKLYVRGNNNAYCSPDSLAYNQFTNNKNCYVYGNIMSLINKKDFANLLELTDPNTFRNLFADMNIIMDSSKYIMLPATTLTPHCYSGMFRGCTGLTTVPSNMLPATTLADECYNGMFRGCISLTSTPELPATILTTGCYDHMFTSCRSLSTIICYATNISANYCTYYWSNNVSASGTFIKNSTMNSWPTGDNGIPLGWNVQDYVEPQTVL